MKSNSQTPVSGDLTTKKPNGKDVVSSAEPMKRAGQTGVSPIVAVSGDPKSKKLNGKAVVSSAESIKRAGQTGVSPVVAVSGDPKSKKLDGKAVVSSAEPIRRTGGSCANAVSGELIPKKSNDKAVVSSSDEVLFFKDVKFGPQQGEIRFRLIHFWEARNAHMKILIGLEMILIDGQGTVIQGFIPPTRIDTYLPHMVAGSLYRLNKFYGSKSKTVYRVAEQDVTIAFSWNSVLSVLENSPIQFLEDRFRFYSFEEFEAVCDLKGDLYDYVGHMKLVNEQTLSDSLVLDEVEIASSRRILVHVQTHDGPVMKLYLWDKAATDFCVKFKAQGNTPSVILVTTVNPKRFGGALSISSLSSSRVFFDLDVQPTRDYLTWLGSNSDVANRVNADIVTKAETVTIGEIFSYIKQEGAKVAWFECTATIDDVMVRSAWYYIACGGCKTKATKGPTTLMCKKCGKAEVAGVAEYLTNISVYDNNDHARFVLLCDVGRDLTGKLASELVESYFEANESVGDDAMVPVPQALVDTIGQTRKFVVKVSKHNLEGKTQALTVTKVLPLEAPVLEGVLEENVDEEPADERDEAAGGTMKRNSDGIESGETKRTKCG
uniref:Replication factor A C-terminal domain-containing protein n=1 Tax=Brassica oleracea var. oleracea TaxID=109376 RepID=A0A0D3BGY7_BRAOL